jgi:uncharacterized phage protein gp47/JayE
MPVKIQSLDEIHGDLNNNLRGRFPDGDLSPTKPWYKIGRAFAAIVQAIQKQLSDAQRNFFPQNADDEGQVSWGDTLKLPRKGPTGARGSNVLRVYGDNGSAVTVGLELTSKGGLRYQINENDTIPLAGFVDVDVVAVDVGEATRLEAGEILTFVSPPSGVEAEAELQADLVAGGEEQESTAAYGQRLADAIGEGSAGGNRADFRAWALELDWVRDAYIYPNRHGRGTIDVVALASGSGTARVPTADERAELLEHLKQQVAVHLENNIRVLEVTTRLVDSDVLIRATTDGPNTWDWDDSDGGLEVASYDIGTRTITLTADRPDDLAAGHRISISDVSADDDARTGEQLIVGALGAGADEIILADEPPVTPAAGDLIYAGGDLVDPVRAELAAHYDTLGPVIGTSGVGNWVDEVDPVRLLAEAVKVDEVLKGTIQAPATTVVPSDTSFPLDTSVELLIPGETIVRRLP